MNFLFNFRIVGKIRLEITAIFAISDFMEIHFPSKNVSPVCVRPRTKILPKLVHVNQTESLIVNVYEVKTAQCDFLGT